jgi:acetolactate synthase-1/2/3 large subunit
MIKHTQNLLFKGHRTAVDEATGVSCPDYSKVGEAFGFETYRIHDWMTAGENLEHFLNGNSPAILEVFMDPEQDFLPKVKGVANEDGTITPASLEEMSPLLPFKDIEEAMLIGVSERSKKIVR